MNIILILQRPQYTHRKDNNLAKTNLKRSLISNRNLIHQFCKVDKNARIKIEMKILYIGRIEMGEFSKIKKKSDIW